MMPMMPPGATGTGAPERSDAAGLLATDTAPWTTGVGTDLVGETFPGTPGGEGGAAPGGAGFDGTAPGLPAGSGVGVPEDDAAAGGGVTHPATPELGSAGGVPPMMPMMPPGATGTGAPERSDASALVATNAEPWSGDTAPPEQARGGAGQAHGGEGFIGAPPPPRPAPPPPAENRPSVPPVPAGLPAVPEEADPPADRVAVVGDGDDDFGSWDQDGLPWNTLDDGEDDEDDDALWFSPPPPVTDQPMMAVAAMSPSPLRAWRPEREGRTRSDGDVEGTPQMSAAEPDDDTLQRLMAERDAAAEAARTRGEADQDDGEDDATAGDQKSADQRQALRLLQAEDDIWPTRAAGPGVIE